VERYVEMMDVMGLVGYVVLERRVKGEIVYVQTVRKETVVRQELIVEI
jgi:hypothetical protein